MTSSASDNTPSKQAVLRALPGARHFHVCGSALVDRASHETAASALARASSLGASTSLDLNRVPPTTHWPMLRGLVGRADVVFTDSETLRTLTESSRVGAAATATLSLGASAVAVGLRTGGSRVYAADDAVRIPSFGEESEGAGNAFASGYLLGWLIGARAEVCGVLGAAAARVGAKSKLPDRRELALRMLEARKNPAFSKLVPALGEAGRVLDKTRRLPRRDLAASSRSVDS